jgi:hypothetical protein
MTEIILDSVISPIDAIYHIQTTRTGYVTASYTVRGDHCVGNCIISRYVVDKGSKPQ